MTSSDVLDTSFNIQLVQSGKILMKDIEKLLSVIKKKALKYKMTPCIGRSHGIHAEPITFGLKLATYYEEFKRNKKRLENAIDEMHHKGIDTVTEGFTIGAEGFKVVFVHPRYTGGILVELTQRQV